MALGGHGFLSKDEFQDTHQIAPQEVAKTTKIKNLDKSCETPIREFGNDKERQIATEVEHKTAGDRSGVHNNR